MVKVCQIDIFLVIVGHFLYTLNMKNKAIGGHYVPLINSYISNMEKRWTYYLD